MGEYGPASVLVHRLIERAERLTATEAADLFRAHANRVMDRGSDQQRTARGEAVRAAAVASRLTEFWAARRAAARAWNQARHGTVGPWLSVSAAVADAAGALVVEDVLGNRAFEMLFGPWGQAIGRLTPMGPGTFGTERLPVLAARRTRTVPP